MKPYFLRPQAREDRRNQVRYYRKEAGAKVAGRLVAALRKALQDLERQPRIGSPALGLELGLDGMRIFPNVTASSAVLPGVYWSSRPRPIVAR